MRLNPSFSVGFQVMDFECTRVCSPWTRYIHIWRHHCSFELVLAYCRSLRLPEIMRSGNYDFQWSQLAATFCQLWTAMSRLQVELFNTSGALSTCTAQTLIHQWATYRPAAHSRLVLQWTSGLVGFDFCLMSLARHIHVDMWFSGWSVTLRFLDVCIYVCVYIGLLFVSCRSVANQKKMKPIFL